jgi:PAS domain S-box-containing protein
MMSAKSDIEESEIGERQDVKEVPLESYVRLLLESIGEGVFVIDNEGRCTLINRAGARMLGYAPEELLGKHMHAVAHHTRPDGSDYPADQCPIHTAMEAGYSCRVAEEVFWRGDGTCFPVEYSSFPVVESGILRGAVVVLMDITERKLSEETLKASELRFRQLAENIREVFWMRAPEFREILYVSPAYETIWGRSCEVLYRDPLAWTNSIHPEDRKWFMELLLDKADGDYDVEYRIVRPDGEIRWIHDRGFPIRDESGRVHRIAGIAEDITLRKQAEQALQASEQFLQLVMNNIPLSVFWKDTDFVYQGCNRSYAQIVGIGASAEIVGKKDEDISREHTKSDLFRESDQMVIGMDAPILHMVETVTQADGTPIQADISKLPLHDMDGRVVGVLGTLEDITERSLAQEQLKRQFERLTALRAIDVAILGSPDIRITLNVIVEQMMIGLDIHAARILLLNPYTHTLEFASGRGFTTNHATHAALRLGEGFAGRAALERIPVDIANLNEVEEDSGCSDLMEAERFWAYHVIPLISKGIVQGVLEVFDREPRSRDTGWHEFLETLGGQAAIAIDNATLFTDLQRTNAELMVAYDTTLEGWVKALDLRDKETEGHTQRVTMMTLRLAKAMGLCDAELAHVRRGALLHDIGKLAIPDAILLKPGNLTEEERQVMRRHPEYAYHWLRPISFLRPALDIPYCHHEKWDGTGYPRGLKGEEIPLAARLFAVIDVWDALRSDRPYRAGWPEQKVYAHIRSLAGTHFEPRVVEAFLEIVNKDAQPETTRLANAA